MPANSLIKLFREDIETAQALLELIESEFEALTERNLEQLSPLLSQKQHLLELLAQHTEERTQFLRNHQLPADRDGLQRLAAQSAEGDALLQAANELSDLIQHCKSGNQINGRLIRTNQGSIEKSLAIMRGVDSPSLYNSKGSAARASHPRPLNKA